MECLDSIHHTTVAGIGDLVAGMAWLVVAGIGYIAGRLDAV
jgi:hypothetical protein